MQIYLFLLCLFRISSYFELFLEPLFKHLQLFIYRKQVLPRCIPLYLLIFDNLAVSEPECLTLIAIESPPLLRYVDSIRDKAVTRGNLDHGLTADGRGCESLHLEDEPPHITLRGLDECEPPVAP
jgi:hypothetical protein